MYLELRMHAASYHLWAYFADESRFASMHSVAFLNDHSDVGRHEYLVLPETASWHRRADGIPVHVRPAVQDDDSRSQSLLATLRIPTTPPYIVVRTRRTGLPSAILYGSDGAVTPFDRVTLVGHGQEPTTWAGSAPVQPSQQELESGPWSRTIGAFGRDHGALHRIQSSHYALIGCGRNGALLAQHLAALGVHGRITLVDDDLVEEHSIHAMGLHRSWIGTAKVDAVETLIRRVHSDAPIVKLAKRARSSAVIKALSQSDLILCAVDHGEARLVAATAGAAYMRPVIDVGSGVHFGWRTRGWRAGVDVRLTGPDECLLCLGGVTNLDQEREIDWREQRAGSLRSINSVATGIAQNLIERYFSAGSTFPVWIRLEFLTSGDVVSRVVRREGMGRRCPVCRLVARGDSAFFSASTAEPTGNPRVA